MLTDRKRGFTLVELMIVIVIISILANIATVTYRHATVSEYDTEAIATMSDFYTQVNRFINDWGVKTNEGDIGVPIGCTTVDVRNGVAKYVPKDGFFEKSLDISDAIPNHWLYQICVNKSDDKGETFFVTASRTIDLAPGTRMHIISNSLHAPLIDVNPETVPVSIDDGKKWTKPKL